MKYIKKYEKYVDIKVDRPEDDVKQMLDGLKDDLNDILLDIKHKNTINFYDHFIPAERSATDHWTYNLTIEISDGDGHLYQKPHKEEVEAQSQGQDPMLVDAIGDIMRYCKLNLEEEGFKCSTTTYYYDRISHLTEMSRIVLEDDNTLDPEKLFKIDAWEDRTVDYIDVITIRISKD